MSEALDADVRRDDAVAPGREAPASAEAGRVAVIVVNYKTPEMIGPCLDSLAEERASGVALSAFVGDADSGDGSVEIVDAHIRARGYGDWASVYQIGYNGGFAYANNHVLEHRVLPDPGFAFVHFLNPDAYVRPGAVRALRDFLVAHPEAGAVGSRMEDPDGSMQASAFRVPTPWREFFRGARIGPLDRLVPSADLRMRAEEAAAHEPLAADWICGASFMMPRRVLETVGSMDARYFLYFDETDLCARLRKAGLGVWYLPRSRVVHLCGQATGLRSTDTEPKRVPAFWLNSRYKFFRDHYGRAGAALATALYLAGDLANRAYNAPWRRRARRTPHLWRDYLTHGFRLPRPPR
ncbi:MAG: glycosyltransferase [Paracoccaceae bacterium]